jgi:ADP-heptose:LPS heptosyltransferase
MWSYLRLAYYLLSRRTIFLRCATHGLGDNLLLSAVLPYLREQHPEKRIIVETRWPELFLHNPNADWVTELHMKTTGRHIKPKYHVDRETRDSIYRQIMSKVGAEGEGFPEVFLTEAEITEIERRFPFEYVTICPRGKTTFCANRKEWGPANFQRLRDLMPEVEFIQIGIPTDPLLENVVDGRHLTARQSAAAIKKSSLFVGLEGGLMHLARAVGRRSVIIYGGFIKPEISGYLENVNVYRAVPCSPCFHSDYRHDQCETMECMKAITPEMVLELMKRELSDLPE